MDCPKCGLLQRRNTWTCDTCGSPVAGGVVFVTGISGSGTESVIRSVQEIARSKNQPVLVHDVGQLMHKFAREYDPGTGWDRILDASPQSLRFLRALAFQEIANDLKDNAQCVHLVDLHLCFRWRAYLTKGFEPNVLRGFIPHTRCFVNVMEDLSRIQARLRKTSWGEREVRELMLWRDEELFLTDIYADVCGRVDSFLVACAEPPTEIHRIIWHPEVPKVYLSFPITAILDDVEARAEIESFRDAIREFLVVFDPYASKDYDETYQRDELKELRKEVGELTVDRDFRFIDQADAVIVYYPRKVTSKGVDSEMRHAIGIGKPIFLYSPEELGGGPFQPLADHICHDRNEFMSILRRKFASRTQP